MLEPSTIEIIQNDTLEESIPRLSLSLKKIKMCMHIKSRMDEELVDFT